MMLNEYESYKLLRCEFVTDITGIYFTPLLGYSKVRGQKAIWVGWLWWLFTIKIGGTNE